MCRGPRCIMLYFNTGSWTVEMFGNVYTRVLLTEHPQCLVMGGLWASVHHMAYEIGTLHVSWYHVVHAHPISATWPNLGDRRPRQLTRGTIRLPAQTLIYRLTGPRLFKVPAPVRSSCMRRYMAGRIILRRGARIV